MIIFKINFKLKQAQNMKRDEIILVGEAKSIYGSTLILFRRLFTVIRISKKKGLLFSKNLSINIINFKNIEIDKK